MFAVLELIWGQKDLCYLESTRVVGWPQMCHLILYHHIEKKKGKESQNLEIKYAKTHPPGYALFEQRKKGLNSGFPCDQDP